VAVRFSASSQEYTRTESLGSTSQWSVCCWVKISVDRNTFQTAWSLDNGTSAFYVLETLNDGTTMTIADGVTTFQTRAFTVGRWYFVGVSVNGANGTWVTRAADDSSFTVQTWSTGTTQNIATMRLGASPFSGEWLNGCLAAFKFWTGVTLTSDQLQAEAWSYLPQRTANLRSFHPLTPASVTDFSGNGLTLSGVITPTTEDGPPISWRIGHRRIRRPSAVNATPTPAALAAVVAIPTPTISAGAAVTPTTAAAVVAVPTPTVSGGATATPSTVAVAAAVPGATILTGGSVSFSPDPVAVTTAVPAPTISLGTTVIPSTLAVSVAVPTPTIVFPLTVTVVPEVLAITVGLLPVVVDTPRLPGALIDADGQLEYGDPPILLGAGTYFRISEIHGWDTKAAIDNGNVNRQRRHGARSGTKYAQQRIVSAQVTIESFANPELVADRYAELEAGTPILEDGDEVPLVIRLYNGQTRLAYGAIIDLDVPDDADYSVGAARVGLQFACSDPLRYSIDAQTAVINPNTTVHATNAGNARMRPQIRIAGACTNPQVINETTGRRLAFGIVLGPTDWITVDCNNNAARLNDETSVLAGLSASSVPSPEAYWLVPGDNQLTFTCTSPGAGARLDYVYRHAYL
jgi:hypothetical protein